MSSQSPLSLLLDTQVLLYWLAFPEKLSEEARDAIAHGANLVLVSAVTVWEMQIKAALGKVQIPDDLGDQMKAQRFEELPIRISHTHQLQKLPLLHRDPFDRMLVAQAKAESLVLVSTNPQIQSYGGKFLPA